MNDKALSLAEIITAIVDDLYKAERTRIELGRGGRIGVNQVELELKASTVKEGAAGLKFYILGANFTGKSESVSTIKVTLSALDEDAKSTFMFSERPKLTGDNSQWLWKVQASAIQAEIDRLLDGVRSGELSGDQLRDGLEGIRQRLE